MKNDRREFLVISAILAAALLVSVGGAIAGDDDAAAARLKDSARNATANLEKTRQAVELHTKEHTPPKLVETPFVGEYVGTLTAKDGNMLPAVLKVYCERRSAPKSSYRSMLYATPSGQIMTPGPTTRFALLRRPECTEKGGKLLLELPEAKLVIEGKKCTGTGEGGAFQLARFKRISPTLGAKPPAGATVLLPFEPGKTPDMSEWASKTWKAFNDGSMQVGSDNNLTVRKFRNFRLHAEFMTVSGKGGGNSGFYLLDRYEVQVFNSFGLMPEKGGCGAIYQTFAPSANVCLPPGQWQTYDITFHAPEMDGKKVLKHPRITVVHNGVVVHDDVEIPHATGHAQPKGDAAEGPIVLQDHGCPDRFRNIWVVELDGR